MDPVESRPMVSKTSVVDLMPRLGLMYSDCTSLTENWMSVAIACRKYNT